MAEWLVKDLSKLTGVSVQTLHHYDRIHLLKPESRLASGYRVYSEKDLLKLQQIIALKFFGFRLSQIKVLLAEPSDALEHFTAQVHILEQKANALLEGAKALRSIIADVKDNQSIPWKTIIQIIEVYHMTKHLEHEWVKEIFTPEELKEYAQFERELKAHATPEQQAAFEKSWSELLEEVKSQLDKDPASEVGTLLGEKFMRWVNQLYGKKYAHLRTKKWEKGFSEGRGLTETGLTPEMVSWIDKAMDAYFRKRIYDILDKVGKIPSSTVLTRWNEMLDDMYGDEVVNKKTIREIALKDDKVSQEAKKWLKSLSNSEEGN
jgi:DNA-binding transcriptional MerR regulator